METPLRTGIIHATARSMKQFLFYLGFASALVLPLFNIPLILKIRWHKSAENISLTWAVGVWICTLLMIPQVLLSTDWSYKIFGVVNFILFSVVFYHVFRYRKGSG